MMRSYPPPVLASSYVRIYRRNGEKLETAPPANHGRITLESLNLILAFEEIYEDVEFEPLRAAIT